MCKVNTIRETIRTTCLYASPALKSEYGLFMKVVNFPALYKDTPLALQDVLILCATSSVFIAISPLAHCINLSNNFFTYVRI